MKTRRILAAGLALALWVAGCARATVVEAPRAGLETPCIVPVPRHDQIVGVALSGGGSRAALFGAAGLEALGGLRTSDGASVLEQVSYLSGVSGGSMAATYYALNKPTQDVRVLDAAGGMTVAYRAFFDRFRSALTQDFEGALIRRHLRALRWLNSSLAARSLFEVLDRRLLGEATMSDVGRRQTHGDSPGLIVNTTLYNNGRRLALTTLPPDAMQYDFFRDLDRAQLRRGEQPKPAPVAQRRWALLMPMTPLDIHLDPCAVRLAAAAAASASFPPFIGPITLRVGGETTYWHAGDGGLYENQGIESLLFLFLKQIQHHRARRALVIAFDSSFPFSVGDRRLSVRERPFSLLTFDFSRIPSIMEERATTYQTLFFRSLQIEGVLPGEREFRLVTLRHVDARWREDLRDLPEACRNERVPLSTPAAVRQRIAEIPTRLRLPSACDRQLITVAAGKLVADHAQEIVEFFD